jgi:hypothetical protein
MDIHAFVVKYFHSFSFPPYTTSCVVYSSPRISGFSHAATWSSSLCISQRVANFVDTLSMLQPWEGGYDRLEQALLVEIQRSCAEIVENYQKLISLHEVLQKKVHGNSNNEHIGKVAFEGNITTTHAGSIPCGNTVMKIKFSALPRWITDLITMQTPILRL